MHKKGRVGLTRLEQWYDADKTKYSVQEQANLIKQKYTTPATAAQNIKNYFKYITENEMTEQFKTNQWVDSSTGNLEDSQMQRKIPGMLM